MDYKEKSELLKDTIIYLYSKEGRSFSYISKLLNINRSVISKKIKEWEVTPAHHKRYLTPSNQKFLNKYKPLIKSRIDNNINLNDISSELNISRDKLYRTFIVNDDVLYKSYLDYKNRILEHKNAIKKDHVINHLDGEEWKSILGYSNYYISNYGRIKKKLKDNRFIEIKSFPNKNNGRLYVKIIRDDGIKKNLLVSRIVGHNFIEGFSDINNTINHKDGCVSNNHATNLEWVSQSENSMHSYRILNRVINRGKRYKFDYILYNGKFQFKTVAAFARFLNKSETQVRRYLDNPIKYNIEFVNLDR